MTENQKLKNNKEEEKNKEELEEEEKKNKINSLRKAGKIAQHVKEFIKPKVKVGAKVIDLINATEAKIEELGGLSAFPVNISINNIAAHYTSPPKDDGLTINDNDIVKIDLGVHIEGYIVDTAFTVKFNEDKSLENIIQAT
ncbi:MAG: M24 family metallopeptidase, partial [Promethearchaeota archaeon]